jgi:hypothetical protein
MIRHLRPTDTTALLPFRHAAGPAQAFTVAGALEPALQGFPVTRYVALALSLRAWRQCWVDADDHGIRAVARIGARNSPQAWEVRDLFTVERDEERCAQMLREVRSAAVEQQVLRVFLRAEQDSWLIFPARRAGYEPNSAETLYVLAHASRNGLSLQDAAPEGIRARQSKDDAALFRLYCATAPVEVRAESGMTSAEWWSSLEKAWKRPHEMVLDRESQIAAWMRYGPVQGWWYFTIMARQTAVDDLPGLIQMAISQSAGRPIATLVAAYDTAQAAVLERLGFTPERKFDVMTQTMATRVRAPKGVVVAAS